MSKLPVQLVHLLRRLVNVLSTLSLAPRPPTFSIWSWLVSADALSIDLGCRTYSRSTQDAAGEHGHGCESSPESTPSPSSHDEQRPAPPQANTEPQDTIHRLMSNPTLFDPARAPRYPIVLCHGLYGFDVRGPAAFPSLRLHYWSSVLSILKRKLGAEVIITGVPGTGSIASRAENLDRILQQRARGRGINLMAHSMGGLDCRHLISHIQPSDPFMDWCAVSLIPFYVPQKVHRRNQHDQQYLGLGRRQSEPAFQHGNDSERQAQPDLEPVSPADPNGASEKRETAFRLSLSTLPSSFTTLLLSLIDSPAYANLTTSYLNDVFNPSTPNDPNVKYFSVASRIDEMNIWHPLWLPKMVLDEAERKAKERLKAEAGYASYTSCTPPWEQEDEWGNDGLVTVQSARWGEFLGILSGCDHWEIRGARGMEMNVELPSGIGNITNRVTGEGWTLGDWSRFIGAWKKQEKGTSESLELVQATSIAPSATGETEQIAQDSRNDPVVKASTDKLSVVFDWIVDHVPTSSNASSPKENLPPKKAVKNDLATKFDLERFYVALTRKLYDEGL